MTAGAPWQRVLLMPLQRRRNQGSMWPLALIVGLLALFASIALWLPMPIAIRLGIALMALLGVLCGIGWFWLVADLIAQNQPTAARLVPGQVRTLRDVWLAGLLLMVALAAAVGALLGHVTVGVLATVSMALLTAWLVRFPLLGFFVWMSSASMPFVAERLGLGGVGDRLLALWVARPLATDLIGVLVAAAAIAATRAVVFQEGGARHRQSHGRRLRLRLSMQQGTPWRESGARRGWAGGLQRLANWPYRRALARLSARRDSAVLPRALAGLGPMLHWSGVAGNTLVFGGMALLFWFVVWQLNPTLHRASAAALSTGAAFAMLAWVGSSAGQAVAVLYRGRREQALLALLPGMPRGAALNRQLARRLLRQFGVVWFASTAFGVVVIEQGGVDVDWFTSFAAAALWPLGWLCTDWARMRRPEPMKMAGRAFVPVLLALAALAAQHWLAVPAAACVGLLAAGALAEVGRRYRAVLRAPQAFPAARFG